MKKTAVQPALPKTPHARPARQILRELESDPARGLSTAEAEQRLARYGPNALLAYKPVSVSSILFNQFRNAVTALLAAAAVLAFLFGEWKEAAAIATVLAINGAIGFVTELRAVRSMEALRKLASLSTRVRREGAVTDLPAEDLVPGDIIVLEGGDIVTADLRLVEAYNIAADESLLTGESLAVDKHVQQAGADAPLTERPSMAFKGTSITRGSGVGVVVATGMETELGHISRLVEEAKPETSPLEHQLTRLSGQLIGFTLAVVTIICIIGIARGQDVLLMVKAAIALAVAAIPEGLPIVATMALARGMWRMARHNALIERLAAVETLGATTVIFSDKTGTLTENKMALTELRLSGAHVHVRSDPPAFLAGGKAVRPEDVAGLDDALTAMVLCSSAELSENDNGGTGDPLELALLRAGRLAGKERKALLRKLPMERQVAFDAETKMMASVHRKGGGYTFFVKGAPEAVIEKASHVVTADGIKTLGKREAASWLKQTEEMATQGMRLLAIATKQGNDLHEEAYGKLALLGILGLQDPPRSDVADAIERCREAGIRVIMMTGDHAATARTIAASIGLSGPDANVIEGRELKPLGKMSKADRREALDADIFARVSPSQKLDLISLYQRDGQIVAMTGDGVNDAPALKKADIGVAMGLRGTQVARAAAAMVLRDDAFSTIVTAIREGRVIFRNLQNFVTYLLSCNLSEILIVGLAVLAGLPLPLLPLQILFLNLVTDVFPAFALGAGEGERQVLKRSPRDPKRPIITRQLWGEILGHGISITLATLGALILARQLLGLEGEAAVTVSFITLAFAQLWHVFNMRDPRDGIFLNAVTRNKFVWGSLVLCAGLTVAVTWIPLTADLLKLHAPDIRAWMLILAFSFAPVLVGQAGKQAALLLYLRRSRAK